MSYKTLYIPDGIPNLQTLFPAVDLSTVEEWFVEALDAASTVIATTRVNKIGCCCNSDKIRIHFINSVGEIDSINFGRVEENEEVKSSSWTKTLGYPFNRSLGGSYRQNITSNESVDAETKCYPEKDQYWIKELFESPIAWLEMNLPNGFNSSVSKEYVPIEILDGKFPTKKKDQRYEYLVKIKFAMSNANINLR